MQKNIEKPNLFILGAPKCGTTSLASYLSAHPRVFVSKIKEPHYFNLDSHHRYYFSEKEYTSLFSEATQRHRYLCEASVWYLYSNRAVDEILKFNPDARFIVMLRNPADLYFSLHKELLFGGTENEKSPVRAWELQEERKQGKHIPLGASAPELLYYGEVCKLGSQLQRASENIAKERLKVIFLEDLKENAKKVHLELLDFLDVEKIPLNSYPVENPGKKRKFPLLSRTLLRANRLKRALGIKSGVGLGNRLNSLNVSEEVWEHTPETVALRERLVEYFKDDIALLEQLTQRDLSPWTQTEMTL